MGDIMDLMMGVGQWFGGGGSEESCGCWVFGKLTGCWRFIPQICQYLQSTGADDVLSVCSIDSVNTTPALGIDKQITNTINQN